jgi:ABC-type transport system involved in multi-copper enzyme maturation permease subunit
MIRPAHQGALAAGRRIRLIAQHTLAEAVHLRLTLGLGLMSAVLMGASYSLREFNFGGAELKFISDFGLGALGLGGGLLAALVTAQLFFQDLETHAIYTVLTRPGQRWEYIVGKFTGVAALLALFFAVLSLLLVGLLQVRAAELGGAGVTWTILLCTSGLLWLKSTLIGAMTLFVGTYARSALFTSCLGLLLAIVGQLQAWAQQSGWDWLRGWPNLALFDAEAFLGIGQIPSVGWLIGALGYWVAYVALFNGLAAYIFQRREI